MDSLHDGNAAKKLSYSTKSGTCSSTLFKRRRADFTDVPPEECECDEAEYIDHRLGEMADGKVAGPED